MWALDASGQAHEAVLAEERFEADLSAWSLVNADSIEIISDRGAPGNHVLQLTPEKNEYTHAIFRASEEWRNLRIEVGTWYRFRLDVAGHRTSLYLVDMETPVRTFDWLQDQGAFGLEARPGGGAPVWVDDITVTRLDVELQPGQNELIIRLDGDRFAGGGFFAALFSNH